VRRVRVFGSIARDDAGPGSDVDLLVELAPGRTLLDLVGFRRDAAETLGVRVDVATPDMLEEHIRAEVLAEAVPL
jgi:predicted nucleotidyltransferase